MQFLIWNYLKSNNSSFGLLQQFKYHRQFIIKRDMQVLKNEGDQIQEDCAQIVESSFQAQEEDDEPSSDSSSYDEAIECRPLIERGPEYYMTTETELGMRSGVEGGDEEGDGDEKKEDGEGAEEEQEEAAAGSKVGSMKAGDYTIHILVQNARQLIADGDDTCDPVVTFKINDVEGKTSKKNDVSRQATIKFNEHIFLELRGLATQDAQNAILKMEVKHQGFFTGDLIGQYQMPISKIYNMADHTLLNQELGLNDPEADNSNEIKGFVGVSINVQGPDDEAQELNMVSEKILMEKPPLIPTAIKKKYKQAYFRFYYAQNLPIMDIDFTAGFGERATIDAYAKVQYGNCKLKTKVYKMKENDQGVDEVVWMQEMMFPIEIPIKAPIIQIQVMDEDMVSDELCCSLDIPIENLLNTKKRLEGEPTIIRWINLYGGPNDYNSSATAQWMNKNPDKGSEWKGRIMVEYWTEDSKYPKAKLVNLKEDIYKEKLKESMQKKKYFVIGQISAGIALPHEDTKDKKYQIKVCIGSKSWESGEAKQYEANYARWDFQFGGSNEGEFEDSYQHLRRLPDVFVYLMIKGKPACYFRAKITEFTEPNPQWKWYEFTADKAVGMVKEQWKAGFFGFRMYARNVTEEGPFNFKKKSSVWSKGFEKRNRGHLIRCAIYQCALLPPADSNGTSDPYVEIWQPEKNRPKTATSCDTNNPIYYELKEFYVEIPKNISLEEYPPVLMNVFDTDEGMFSKSADFMGRAVVFLHEILDDDQINDGAIDKLPFRGLSITDDIPYPQFFPIKNKMSDTWDPETGPSILCSFSIVDYSKKYKVATEDINLEEIYEIRPRLYLNMPDLKIKEFQCKVTILGLRELVSPGILPIRKAFVKFNLKSLLKAEQAKGVEDIKTQPKDGGPNPNLKTKIEFQVKVSQDKTFCPQMTCNCYDQLFLESFPQPQIGTFTLKVGKTMFDMMEFNENENHENEKIIQILKELKLKLERQVDDLDNRVRTAEMLIPIRDEINSKVKSKKERRLMRLETLKKQQTLENGQINLEMKDEAAPPVENGNAEGEPKKEKTQKEMKAEFLAEQKKKEEAIEAERAKAQQALAKSKTGFANVVYPIYKWDERLSIDVEVEKPNDKIYMPVGYNEKKPDDGDLGNKHYRRFYNKELERVVDPNGENLVISPFLTESITRAQQKKKKKGMLKGLFGGGGNPDDDDENQFEIVFAGKFKGILKVYNEQEYMNEREKIFDQILKIQQLFKECYNLELAPHNKQWEIDMDKLHPDKIESYNQMKIDLGLLKDALNQAGLGALKLEKKVGRFLYDTQLQKKLEKNIQCKVQAYILEGFNMAKRDLFSDSDPFLIVKCGKEEFNEEKNYQEDEPNPKFNKCYEFLIDFPGSYPLEVSVYDYDLFFGNELIGKTQVDLDDRFFSMEWQSIENKPIEYRELYHKEFDKGQGTVKMWVDIMETSNSKAQGGPTFCAAEPQKIYEARLVIWKTKEIPHMDMEGCSDVFFRTYFDDPNKDKTTDTHWRNSDGVASFNWRIIHELKSLNEDYILNIEGWDKDIIASNDLIGSFKIDIGPMFNDSYLTGRTTVLTKEYWESYLKQALIDQGDDYVNEVVFDGDEEVEGTAVPNYTRFWVPLRRFDNEKNEEVQEGWVQCTLHIVPEDQAEKNKQGVGRDDPNSDPFCPPPVGRIELSLNPFKMLMQLIPPKLRKQICMALCCLVCIGLCVFMGPMIFSNLISTGITSIFS